MSTLRLPLLPLCFYHCQRAAANTEIPLARLLLFQSFNAELLTLPWSTASEWRIMR
jgi:hypothetical protein